MFRKNTANRIIAGLLFLFFLPALSWAQALGPGDSIRIWVKGEPDLSVDRTLGADGVVQYPLVGAVQMNGMSVVEAGKMLTKMLDDGYLRDPLVQVSLNKKAPGRNAGSSFQSSVPSRQYVPAAPAPAPREVLMAPSIPGVDGKAVVVGEPLSPSSQLSMPARRPVLPAQTPIPAGVSNPSAARLQVVPPSRPTLSLEVIDGMNGNPIPGAALLMGGKIYQSNRRGQMTVEDVDGSVILMADGYRLIQGPRDRFIRRGNVSQIVMDRVTIAKEVTIRIVDAASQEPLSEVLVKMNAMKVKTNRQGIFRIREIRTEYGEIDLFRKGYRPLRQILDFKDGSERLIPLVRTE